eukprot:CAMPEP_0119494660 /NCGR_PEP_ID=MMETSP1344-20130328/18541_1 /TAXON_ID=236787 /ORGANISM="Florenciella parvula, Strain CCMP2471" /LENGTH=35 /DNA_ID= /DNA_START= /DNA_END= /DNA_ORIENTATION=
MPAKLFEPENEIDPLMQVGTHVLALKRHAMKPHKL